LGDVLKKKIGKALKYTKGRKDRRGKGGKKGLVQKKGARNLNTGTPLEGECHQPKPEKKKKSQPKSKRGKKALPARKRGSRTFVIVISR